MKRSSQSGFTLIELAVVIAIIAIMVAVSSPMFLQSIAKQKVETETYKVVEQITTGRGQAIANNTFVRVMLKPSDGTYSKQMYDPDDKMWRPSSPIFTLKNGVSFGEIAFPNDTITFTPRGTVNEGMSGEITIADNKGGRFIISVTYSTGKTEVKKG